MKFLTKLAAQAAAKTASYISAPEVGYVSPLIGLLAANTPGEMAAGLAGGHLGHHLGRRVGTAAGALLTHKSSDPLTLTAGMLGGHDLGGLAGELIGQYGAQHLVSRYNDAQARKFRNRRLAVAGLGGAAALGGLGLYHALSRNNTDDE
jgi:hypothetical protein